MGILSGCTTLPLSQKEWLDKSASDVTVSRSCASSEFSLKGLEFQLKAALLRGEPIDPSLSLNGLTDISGYRWYPEEGDIYVIGETCSDSVPILLEQFVKALQIGHFRAIGMTLLPEDINSPTQHVIIFPPNSGLEDTQFIAPFTRCSSFLFLTFRWLVG